VSDVPFENVLLKLWSELPHDTMEWLAASHTTSETLKRWGIPVGFPEEVLAQAGSIGEFAAREYACGRWAWGIPSEEAIAMLVRHSPIVEIGAGTGYWARLVAEAGGDIVAYDQHPPAPDEPKGSDWDDGVGTYYDVRRGGPSAVAFHQDRTLFLCWPPRWNRMASESLDYYKGSTVIFAGELGGCTADGPFYEAITGSGWEEVESLTLPRWACIRDSIHAFKRKENIAHEV
jgi:hypothetical protein